ncbi:MAG TPA: DUF6526 family protein [Chitinophagaceae bacterium]|nr:DUF6526 family protein [Chitinophagaceae bacterium]
MNQQNYKNHGRYVAQWHFLTGGAVIALLIGSIINLVNSSKENLYSASLLLVVSLILISIFWYARAFALRAQDRAIRAEENFRHYILTGKPFPKELRMGQIIALRFASDEEFPVLTQKAVSGSLRSNDIKKAIKNWRPDYNRA